MERRGGKDRGDREAEMENSRYAPQVRLYGPAPLFPVTSDGSKRKYFPIHKRASEGKVYKIKIPVAYSTCQKVTGSPRIDILLRISRLLKFLLGEKKRS